MSDTRDDRAENEALRRRVDDLERQLVAYDAAFDGDLDLAEQVAPGQFFVRRRHAAARLPVALLRQVFNPANEGLQRPATETEWAAAPRSCGCPAFTHESPYGPPPARCFCNCHWRRGITLDDDESYLRWLWSEVRPQTQFVSCALPVGTGYHPRIDLAANGRSMPDPVDGTPLEIGESSLVRSGLSGLPRDWTWLATSWRLEIRGGAGWDCAGLRGFLRLGYNGRRIAERPLSDALDPRDQDLSLVIRENLSFEFEAEFQRGVIGPTLDDPARAERPRLYVLLDVIARTTVT